MKRRDEPASTADERFGIETLRQMNELDARTRIQRLGPSAEESILRAVGDAVDLPVRAPRRLLRDETVITGAARLVHIEERDDVTFTERRALDVRERSTELRDLADRDVAGNQRIRNARQLPVM